MNCGQDIVLEPFRIFAAYKKKIVSLINNNHNDKRSIGKGSK